MIASAHCSSMKVAVRYDAWLLGLLSERHLSPYYWMSHEEAKARKSPDCAVVHDCDQNTAVAAAMPSCQERWRGSRRLLRSAVAAVDLFALRKHAVRMARHRQPWKVSAVSAVGLGTAVAQEWKPNHWMWWIDWSRCGRNSAIAMIATCWSGGRTVSGVGAVAVVAEDRFGPSSGATRVPDARVPGPVRREYPGAGIRGVSKPVSA
jgi:hypothetical protein